MDHDDQLSVFFKFSVMEMCCFSNQKKRNKHNFKNV